MRDLMDRELREGDHVKALFPYSSTFDAYDMIVVGFTPQKVKVVFESNPQSLHRVKDPRHLIIKPTELEL